MNTLQQPTEARALFPTNSRTLRHSSKPVALRRNEHIRLAAKPDVQEVEISRAELHEMGVAADIVRSTAEWYRPIVAEKDMAEHSVDERWAPRNFLARECYLGRIGDEIVGFVTLQHCGDVIYVGYAYVPEQFVGRGVGRQLLGFAARTAQERGYRGLVHIAHPEAKWAVRAYEKLGYKVMLDKREDVLAWNHGFLRPFYEEDFVLFGRMF